jgi:hypothetical protein
MQNRPPEPSALEIVGTIASLAAIILTIMILGA